MPNIEQRTVAALKKQQKKPISLSELAKRAEIKKKDKPLLMEVLERLKHTGEVVEKNGRYRLVGNLRLTTAEIVKVNETFGFASPVEGGGDIFIPGRALMGAMPGDIVLLSPKRAASGLPEGEVREILVESDRQFSGVFRLDARGDYVVVPDHYVKFPLKLAKRGCAGLKDGDKILARIARRGARHSEHMAEATAGFGGSDKAASCCAAILASHDIYAEFPLDALEQAKAMVAGEGIHPKELAARADRRVEVIFTIDGEDTKDIDDAVSLAANERGWELGVHIADVSYYVTHKTPLDSEAFVRGTSVYYADSVVPMLPKELSNGICSLNPGEDRLAFSVIVQLGHDAKIESYRFEKTVIRSRLKGVYGEINLLLSGKAGPELAAKYAEVSDMLFLMDDLAKRLTKNRLNRGGVDFDTVESRIVVGEDGSPVDIKPRERGASELIIEEFMLVANEAAARFAIKENLPFVYRVHEGPAPDKLAQLFEVLTRLGVSFKRPKGKVNPEHIAAIIEQVRGSELEDIVNSLALRAMAKARYSEENIGHFGLALDDYTHFTSPIRRYSDLAIHRILSAHITGMRRDNINKRFQAFAGEAAARATAREIAAMSAERSCESAYKAEYMSRRLGGEFEGVISSVTQFGCYVRLENTVEGLLRAQSLPPGDWRFDGCVAFIDTLSQNKLQLGDRLRVRVAAADVSAGHVDFELVNTFPGNRKY